MTNDGLIEVELAAFGTQSNGASAQLLAEPAGRYLDEDELVTLRTVFEEARPRLASRSAASFAFLPMGGRNAPRWALCRLDNEGFGAIGWRGVLWAAIMPTATLDQFDWAVHRLLTSALPPPRLPKSGERLPALGARLATGTSIDSEYLLELDQLAERAGAQEMLLDVATSGQTPEATLVALWDRKVPRWRKHSFSTWTGLGRRFDLIVTDEPGAAAEISDRARHVLGNGPGGRLPLADEIFRASYDIAFPARSAVSESEVAAAADQLAHKLPKPDLDPGNAIFAQLVGNLGRVAQPSYDLVYAGALKISLADYVRERDWAGKQRVFAAFGRALDTRASLWEAPDFADPVARIAIAAHALAVLGADLVGRLHTALTSGPEPLLLSDAARAQFKTVPESGAAAIDWSLWWPELKVALKVAPAPDIEAAAAFGVADAAGRDSAIAGLRRSGGARWPAWLRGGQASEKQRTVLPAAIRSWRSETAGSRRAHFARGAMLANDLRKAMAQPAYRSGERQ